jgi:hypothetical protein
LAPVELAVGEDSKQGEEGHTEVLRKVGVLHRQAVRTSLIYDYKIILYFIDLYIMHIG